MAYYEKCNNTDLYYLIAADVPVKVQHVAFYCGITFMTIMHTEAGEQVKPH